MGRYTILLVPLKNSSLSGLGIENSLHYGLDVTFREDECKIKKSEASENFVLHVLLEIILKYIEIKRNFTYSGVHNIKKVAKVKNTRSYPFKSI